MTLRPEKIKIQKSKKSAAKHEAEKREGALQKRLRPDEGDEATFGRDIKRSRVLIGSARTKRSLTKLKAESVYKNAPKVIDTKEGSYRSLGWGADSRKESERFANNLPVSSFKIREVKNGVYKGIWLVYIPTDEYNPEM